MGHRSLVRELSQLDEHAVRGRGMHKGFLPVLPGVIEANDREAKRACPCHRGLDVVNLEGQVMEPLPMFIEVPGEEVALVLEYRADHFKATLTRKIELDPLEVTFMAQTAPDVGSSEKIHECLGKTDVVHSDRDVVEALNEILETLVHGFDVSHGLRSLLRIASVRDARLGGNASGLSRVRAGFLGVMARTRSPLRCPHAPQDQNHRDPRTGNRIS
jgi:hypothetical protein